MILITGATGMIGRALVERLAPLGVPLRLAVRDRSGIKEHLPEIDKYKTVNVKEHDFLTLNALSMSQLVQGCDTIVHLAGLVHQPHQPASMYELLNLRATKQLADAAGKAGVRSFVFASTSAVYGSPPLQDVCEDSAVRPDSEYGTSKHLAEEYLRQAQPVPRLIVIRPSLVYGRGDRGNMLSLIRQILKQRYFHIGNAEARKSLIYAPDLARVITLLLEKAPPGFNIYNAANPQAPTVKEIADTIAAAGQLAQPIPTIPEALVRAGSWASILLGNLSPLPPTKLDKLTKSATCSTKKLETLSGFEPEFSLLSGLESEIQWAGLQRKLKGTRNVPST